MYILEYMYYIYTHIQEYILYIILYTIIYLYTHTHTHTHTQIYELEQTLVDSAGQGILACYSPWCHRVGCDLATEQQQQ